MRLAFVFVLLAVGCSRHHEDKSERDSKGRSGANIGGQATTAATVASTPPDASVAPLPVEPNLVTLTWAGSITQSTGSAPPVGTACTFSTRATVRRHDGLMVKCGDKILYDESDLIDGATSTRFAIDEHPVAGKVSVFTYELIARDTGSRTGRNQLDGDTHKNGTFKVFRDTIPTFRATIAMAPKREEREGLPIFADNIPPFDVVAKATATLTASTGPLPFTGKTCELRISPGIKAYDCRVQLECAKKIVYGVGTSGYNDCIVRGGHPISFSDQKPSTIDTDPALTVDLDAKTATFADEPKGGATYSASFTLTTP